MFRKFMAATPENATSMHHQKCVWKMLQNPGKSERVQQGNKIWKFGQREFNQKSPNRIDKNRILW